MLPGYGRFFLWYELCFSILLVLLAWALVQFTIGQCELDAFLGGNRQILYSTVSAIAGALLGFVLAGSAIIIALPNTALLNAVKNTKAYEQVHKIFFSALRYLAATTVVALLALFLDTADHPHVAAFYFVIWGLFISSFRLARCFWVLENLVSITDVNRRRLDEE